MEMDEKIKALESKIGALNKKLQCKEEERQASKNRLEANKQLVRNLFEAGSRLDGDEFISYTSDDATFETLASHQLSGVKTREQYLKEFPVLRKALPNGIQFEIVSMIAENDRVHCEAKGFATTADNKEYKNQYSFILTIRDGKVVRFREYMDTDLVLRVLMPTFIAMGVDKVG